MSYSFEISFGDNSRLRTASNQMPAPAPEPVPPVVQNAKNQAEKLASLQELGLKSPVRGVPYPGWPPKPVVTADAQQLNRQAVKQSGGNKRPREVKMLNYTSTPWSEREDAIVLEGIIKGDKVARISERILHETGNIRSDKSIYGKRFRMMQKLPSST